MILLECFKWSIIALTSWMKNICSHSFFIVMASVSTLPFMAVNYSNWLDYCLRCEVNNKIWIPSAPLNTPISEQLFTENSLF